MSKRNPTDKLHAEWFWIDRWDNSSAALLPMEAQGVYRSMLSQAWLRGARLPNDERAIQRAIRCTSDEWTRCWPLLKRYWREDGDVLVNDTQLEVYAKARAIMERQRSAGASRAAQAPRDGGRFTSRQPAEAPAVTPAIPPAEETSLEPAIHQHPVSGLRSPVSVLRYPGSSAVGAVEAEGAEPDETALTTPTADSTDGNGPADDPVQALQYHQAVAETVELVLGRRPREPEKQLVERWRQAGIPLRVVLSALRGDGAGDGPLENPRTEKPRVLAYFEPVVREAHERWARALGQP